MANLSPQAVIVDETGVVVRLRPFPRGRQDVNIIEMETGYKCIRLKPEHVGVVKVGWVTLDDGETFIP